ncbi:MAG: hypothetical protein ABI977_37495 [Acidobacteriota bacterium]
MSETVGILAGRMKDLAAGWASYSTLASLALYVVGYLSLRFHLTALGVGTDLTVLDERYLFTGARFLVYLGSAIPILALFGLVLALVYAIVVYLPYRLMPAGWRARIKASLARAWEWRETPTTLALTGIVLSVVLIQRVMRPCFVFSNLLLRKTLPSPKWLEQLLLAEDDLRMLFFCGLLCGVLVTGGLFVAARRRTGAGGWRRSLILALGALLVIEVLFLPVNYGVLIIDKVLPKVADLGGVEQLAPSQDAWLVWEGKEAVTYLVRSVEPGGASKKLVTVPLKEIKKTQIVRYDSILRCAFDGQCKE